MRNRQSDAISVTNLDSLFFEISGDRTKAVDSRSYVVHYGPLRLRSGQAGNLPLVANGQWRSGVDNILAMTVYGGTTSTYYYVKDHLGSVNAIVDASDAVVESYQYDAWGNTSVFDGSGNPLQASAIGNRYCWQGREISWKTGLYFFRARWYEPVTGRWLSNDPIGISGGLNQYVFCGDNPVNMVDPLGLYDETVHFYMTRLWAAQAGVSPNMARQIAKEDEGTDHGKTHPVMNPWPHFQKNVFRDNRNSLATDTINAAKNHNLKEFGRLLHQFQDTYSHEGYWPLPGHILSGDFTHKPDWFYPETSQRDREAVRRSKILLGLWHKYNPNFSKSEDCK